MTKRIFSDRNAVVTGGTRGIGRAISECLAAEGAQVAAIHRRDRRAAAATAAAIEATGGTFTAWRADVSNGEAIARVLAAVRERFGPIDFVISNAALGVLRPAMELDDKGWEWTVGKNAGAFLKLVRTAVPLMRDGGGRIVALTSWGARRVMPDYAAVGAAKAALESLARHLVPELAPRGITVNLVCPGVVETDALDHFPDRDALVDGAVARTPGGRLVTPEEVAGVVALLCRPEAARIQGQTIVVDGGASIIA